MTNSVKDQSKVIFISSFTEFGERYSYYILQALLILFLVYHFKLNQQASAQIVGTVLGMIYISAIVGGYIADKLLGYYRSAFIGSLMMVIGSMLLSLTKSIDMLYFGLCFIAISTGLIKSNISAFIGHFYDTKGVAGAYRDFGFNMFYVGINLGSFFALLFATYLADHYGYNAAFYSSIIINFLMIINLIIGFFRLRPYIADNKITPLMLLKAGTIIILYMIAIYIVLKHPAVATISIFAAAICCGYILIQAAISSKKYKRVITASLFYILSIFYWACYFQIFISIELFIRNAVTHRFFTLNLSTSQFLSVESLSVLIMGYVMGKTWIAFQRRNRPVNDIDKFNLAFILMALVFILYYAAISYSTAKVPAAIIMLGFFILGISELSLSAIGLSLVTKLAPKKFVSLFMAVWLVTLGIGGKIAGFLAQYVHISNNITQTKQSMQHGLIIFIVITLVGSVLCLIFRPYLIKNGTSGKALKPS